MKRIVLLLPGMLLFILGISAQNLGFWTKIQGPYGGWPGKLIPAENGVLYVNASSQDDLFPARLYRSSDQGLNWTKLSLSLNGQPVHTYVEVGPSGNMYTMIPEGNSASYTLYHSTDEGVTWDFIRDSLPYKSVLETPGGALLARITQNNEFWRSTDGGFTWSLVYTTPSAIYTDGSILQNGGLIWNDLSYNWYRTTDDGQTWQVLDPPGEEYALLFISSTGTIMVADWTKMYRSNDNGQSWQEINIPPIKSIVELATGRLLANRAYDSKILYSDDDGQTWVLQPSDHEMSLLMPSRLPDGSIFGFCNALYRSVDSGQTWQFAATNMDLAQVDQAGFVSGDSIFAGTQNGLWRSFDGGQQWTRLTDYKKVSGNGSDRAKRIFVLGKNGHLATFADSILYWSDDYGDHFTNISPPGGTYDLALAMSPGDSFLFANSATYPRHILRSADHGQSWQTVNDGQENIEFYRMEFLPSGRYFAIRHHAANTTPKLWFSDDQGMTWYPVAGLPPGLSALDLHIDVSGNIYVIDYSGSTKSLFRSNDGGNSWLRLPDTGIDAPILLSSNALGHLLGFNTLGDGVRSLDQGESWFHFPGFQYHLDPFLDPMSPDQRLYGQFLGLGFCRTTNPTTEGAYLDGHVRRDADADCSTADAQMPLRKWVVEATGSNTYWTTSDSLGHYQMFLDEGIYEVQTWTPNNNWWTICEGALNVMADSLLSLDTVDFSAAALAECPLMSVDVSVPRLLRCFDNTLYIRYCNQGTEPADSAWVDVILDPFTDFVSATLPAQDLGFKTYRFFVGDVASTDCGEFRLVVNVDCDSTISGQTHCFTAHAYPDTLCTTVQNWSGATIRAQVNCQDSTLQMKLKNIGSAPSQVLDYIIIIDDVVLMQGTQSYDPGQEINVTQPANGHTWRIQSEQEPGHPFSNIALAFAEGCGGYESLGFINQFPVDENLPSWDRECVQNTASLDPNDKQGFPLGYGDNHKIRPGQELEYLIRFQNTGTDTAYTVVIRDTLSPWLDPVSIQPGASSHPYTWTLSGQGVLSFTFNHILLPDSNVNEAASHGFVNFRIEQQENVPLGTQIFNRAAIYFDFNEPVITNQTQHTVGVDEITGTNSPAPANKTNLVRVSPNPVSESTVFQLNTGVFQRHRLFVSDAFGRKVREAELYGKQYLLQRRELPPGAYFYRVEDAAGRWVDGGTLLLR